MRRIEFANGEYYHVYNRGVEKRDIFSDQEDYERFLESISAFNTLEPIGSLYELSFAHEDESDSREPLVEIVAYCLNPNHYHFILRQVEENGISHFMERLGGGYSWYYNNRNHRTGTLFEGPYKAKHISTNEYLLRLSVYVNFNDQVHQLGDQVAKYGEVSSRNQFLGKHMSLGKAEVHRQKHEKSAAVICETDVVLGQFRSQKAYGAFSKETLRLIRGSKEMQRSLGKLSFD